MELSRAQRADDAFGAFRALGIPISSGNTPELSAKKQRVVESIISDIVLVLREQGLTDFEGNEAEGHAYSVNGRIADHEVRNLHILYAV